MVPQQFDRIFQVKLASWIPFKSGHGTFFTDRQIETLAASDHQFDICNRTVVLLSFENAYASLGGLSVVTRYLPRFLAKAGERVVFMTPYHPNHKAIKKAEKAGRFKQVCSVPFSFATDTAIVTCFQDTSAEIPSYYLKIENQFVAAEDPYNYSDPQDLLIDAALFCCAIPKVCAALGFTKNILFHGHDWETAPIALTCRLAVLSGVLATAKSVLTLHNSYDSPMPRVIVHHYFGKFATPKTVLQAFVPLLSGPLTTVSTPFAHELRNDPLQRGCFTDHLLDVFSRNPPIGIENGLFGNTHPELAHDVAGKTDSQAKSIICERKKQWSAQMRKVVSSYTDRRIIGSLSFPSRGPQPPVFFMSGRLDTMQKGFDTLFHAFSRMKRGSAKLLFSPNVAPDSESQLTFFSEIAKRFPGDIAIWPFRIPQDEYDILVRGSAYLLMPSFYEPFGSATEGVGNGTPVVARATGGLWLQVQSSCDVFIPNFYGTLFSGACATSANAASGILYRERYPDTPSAAAWGAIFGLPLDKRIRSPLYETIVEAAYSALETAVKTWSDQTAYASLIVNGLASLPLFSWDFAVAKYRKVYDAASRSSS